jgi:4-hydroxy-tetrahydrodipicolinate reductase
MKRVIICGYKGKMGQACVDAIQDADDLTLVGKVGRGDSLSEFIKKGTPDVVVDLTHPESVYDNVETILTSGCHAVVGTTGLRPEQVDALDLLAKSQKKALIICPNFAIGAILMMQFAEKASAYMDRVEIVEYHHDQKADAPSGTALKTAELISKSNPTINSKKLDETELIRGARGGEFLNIPIHSVRMPGVVADQDVILGGKGQTLTIKHQTISRESFMPGILLCIRSTEQHEGLVFGLENLL